MWKTFTLIMDIKTMRFKTANLMYKIKLCKFNWSFHLKDLLFSTYNLIYVCDATTSNYFNEYTLVSLKG